MTCWLPGPCSECLVLYLMHLLSAFVPTGKSVFLCFPDLVCLGDCCLYLLHLIEWTFLLWLKMSEPFKGILTQTKAWFRSTQTETTSFGKNLNGAVSVLLCGTEIWTQRHVREGESPVSNPALPTTAAASLWGKNIIVSQEPKLPGRKGNPYSVPTQAERACLTPPPRLPPNGSAFTAQENKPADCHLLPMRGFRSNQVSRLTRLALIVFACN